MDPQYGLCKQSVVNIFVLKLRMDCTVSSVLNLSSFLVDSSFVPPLVYAVMGSSRDIAIGPVAVVCLLLGNLLQDEFDPKLDKEEYQRLAFTATFFAGVTQAALGFLR